MEYDRKSETVKDCGTPVEILASCIVKMDDDFIYIFPDLFRESPEKLYILSRDYELLDQIALPKNQEMIAVTKDRIYLSDPDADPGTTGDSAVYYLEKAQIGSHSLTLAKLPLLVPDAEWDDDPIAG